MNEILKLLLTGLTGVIVGAFATHTFTTRRDMRARRDTFRGFVRQWRAEIYSGKPSNVGFPVDPYVAAYRAKIPAFYAEVEMVRDLFGDPTRFKALTDGVCNLNQEEWKGKDPRTVILPAFDKLLELIG